MIINAVTDMPALTAICVFLILRKVLMFAISEYLSGAHYFLK
jgi:membrane-associated PAP2 superfamily phosphatase